MPAAPPRHPGARRHGLGASGLGEGEVRCRETPETPRRLGLPGTERAGSRGGSEGADTEVLSRRGH